MQKALRRRAAGLGARWLGKTCCSLAVRARAAVEDDNRHVSSGHCRIVAIQDVYVWDKVKVQTYIKTLYCSRINKKAAIVCNIEG